jgi:hypothetical protein
MENVIDFSASAETDPMTVADGILSATAFGIKSSNVHTASAIRTAVNRQSSATSNDRGR